MCCLVTLIVFILMFCYSDTVYIFMTLYFNCMKLFSVGHHKTFNWKMDKYQIFLFSNGNCALSKKKKPKAGHMAKAHPKKRRNREERRNVKINFHNSSI